MSARSIPIAAPGGTATKGVFRHPPADSALLSEEQWAEATRVLHLSGRELQIVRGVFDNHKEAAIAADLGIAPRTVDTHLERLYRKLTVTTRVALVLRVVAVVIKASGTPETGSRNVLPAKPASGRDAGMSGEYPTSAICSVVVQNWP
jgi:DNA-binding CsgD family transcriptional regulator